MAKMNKETFKNPLIWFIAGDALVIIVSILLSIYVGTGSNLANSLVIKKDGQTVSGLNVDDIPIVPGKSSSYDVTLYSNLPDTYNVLVAFEGTKTDLTDLITVSVANNSATYSDNLSSSFTSGFNKVANTYLDTNNGDTFTVTYSFSNEIEESSIVPIDLNVIFKITH